MQSLSQHPTTAHLHTPELPDHGVSDEDRQQTPEFPLLFLLAKRIATLKFWLRCSVLLWSLCSKVISSLDQAAVGLLAGHARFPTVLDSRWHIVNHLLNR